MYKAALREHSFPLFNRRITGPCRAKLSATHQHLEIKTPQPTLQRLRLEYGSWIISDNTDSSAGRRETGKGKSIRTSEFCILIIPISTFIYMYLYICIYI